MGSLATTVSAQIAPERNGLWECLRKSGPGTVLTQSPGGKTRVTPATFPLNGTDNSEVQS